MYVNYNNTLKIMTKRVMPYSTKLETKETARQLSDKGKLNKKSEVRNLPHIVL